MRDEPVIDMRLTHLMALDASLSDVRGALMRAARIRTAHCAEIRALLAQVAADPAAAIDYALVPGAGHGGSAFETDPVRADILSFVTGALA